MARAISIQLSSHNITHWLVDKTWTRDGVSFTLLRAISPVAWALGLYVHIPPKMRVLKRLSHHHHHHGRICSGTLLGAVREHHRPLQVCAG